MQGHKSWEFQGWSAWLESSCECRLVYYVLMWGRGKILEGQIKNCVKALRRSTFYLCRTHGLFESSGEQNCILKSLLTVIFVFLTTYISFTFVHRDIVYEAEKLLHIKIDIYDVVHNKVFLYRTDVWNSKLITSHFFEVIVILVKYKFFSLVLSFTKFQGIH